MLKLYCISFPVHLESNLNKMSESNFFIGSTTYFGTNNSSLRDSSDLQSGNTFIG